MSDLMEAVDTAMQQFKAEMDNKLDCREREWSSNEADKRHEQWEDMEEYVKEKMGLAEGRIGLSFREKMGEERRNNYFMMVQVMECIHPLVRIKPKQHHDPDPVWSVTCTTCARKPEFGSPNCRHITYCALCTISALGLAVVGNITRCPICMKQTDNFTYYGLEP